MISIYLNTIIRFIILVLFQVLILNNVQVSPLLNPLVYGLFILLLPFEIPGWFLLLLAALLGFTVDAFTNTPGLHASATVFMAAFRPLVLRSIAPRDGYEAGSLPRLSDYGILWFFKYSLILIVLQHLFFFVLESFSFEDFHLVLIRTFLSSLISLFLIILSQYIIFKK